MSTFINFITDSETHKHALIHTRPADYFLDCAFSVRTFLLHWFACNTWTRPPYALYVAFGAAGYGKCYFPSTGMDIKVVKRLFPIHSHVIQSHDLSYTRGDFVSTQHPIFTPGPNIRWCNYIVSAVSSAVWKECSNAPHPTKPQARRHDPKYSLWLT